MNRAIVVTLAALAACAEPDGVAIPLPNGAPGIGFDDLRWSPTLGKVIAPGGRAGNVYLVDPETKDVRVVGGFAETADYGGGHDDGPTSADEGRGLLFVTDRTARQLAVVDAGSGETLARTPLGASPDYVRWVAASDELWISEPAAAQIEVFALAGGYVPKLVAEIPIANGPESLVVDQARGRAYTHAWQASTLAVDLRTRAVVGRWPNGCAASRGIELEPEHGWVLVACNEGTMTVLDPAEGGRIRGTIAVGGGFDVMGYAPRLRHAYLAGSACGCLVVVGVSRGGELGVLGRFDAPSDTHCVVADDRRHAWVCAPSDGALRRVDDTFPSWAAP